MAARRQTRSVADRVADTLLMPTLVRLVKLYRTVRARRSIGFGAVAALVALAVLGNSICFYIFDGHDGSITLGDAIWYSLISITTIGYGDFSAASLGARLGTIFFIVVLGLTAFTVFLGMVIDWGTDLALKGQFGMGKALTSNHILIVNFPSAVRVKRLIEELRSDSLYGNREVVIISDRIEKLPFTDERVLFIHGSPLEEETFQRARLQDASMAIVLALSYDDPSTDAVVASAVSVIESLYPDVYTVAECLEDQHRVLFRSVHCDAIVQGLKIADNLLIQEVHDPGVVQMADIITSNLKGATLFSSEVGDSLPEIEYHEVIKRLLDKDINVLCINRGEESMTMFRQQQPQQGDRVIYVANHRRTWPELKKEAGLV